MKVYRMKLSSLIGGVLISLLSIWIIHFLVYFILGLLNHIIFSYRIEYISIIIEILSYSIAMLITLNLINCYLKKHPFKIIIDEDFIVIYYLFQKTKFTLNTKLF